jgi:hypothetical protein
MTLKQTPFFLIFILMIFSSCESFFQKKIHSEDILHEQEKTIQWNEVDTFPIFEGCDELASKDEQRSCFEQYVSRQLSSKISSEFSYYKDFSDTLYLNFLINEQGVLTVEKIESMHQNKLLDSLIRQSLAELPKLYPAQKRDIPVACRLRLPLIVRLE